MAMENNSMASSRYEAFPAGLRVLVVDDDPTWLKILEKMLRKCSYEVTTCGLAREALEMLRERKDRFDIVISDVNMPDMDGFKLLEHVGLEMDLPVIMMSVDGETSRVMKGVQHGACDYLLKPVRMKELRNIWQHVYRKKIHEVKEIESHDSNDDFHFRNSLEDFDERQIFSGSDINFARKRKDLDSKDHTDQCSADPATVKKARVVWSVDLHQKFVNAVNQIGFDKVGPKKILDLMNVPGLTRENVASHLQKYRLYLSRLQKQNEGKNLGGSMQSDTPYNEQPKNFGTSSSSFAVQQSIVASRYEGRNFNGHMQSSFSSKDLPQSFALPNSLLVEKNNIASNFVFTTQKVQSQGLIPKIKTDELKAVVSLKMKESTSSTVKNDEHDSESVNNVSQLGLVLSLKGRKPSADNKSLELQVAKNLPWTGSIPLMELTPQVKHSHKLDTLSKNHSAPVEVNQENENINTFHTQPAVISITCNAERDKRSISQIKPISIDYRSSHVQTVAPVACTIDSLTLQVEHGVLKPQGFQAESEISEGRIIKDMYFEQASKCSLVSTMQDKNLKSVADLVSFPEDLCLYSMEGYGCFENVGLSCMEWLENNHSTIATEVDGEIFDEIGFNSEFQSDSADYPFVDDLLFA